MTAAPLKKGAAPSVKAIRFSLFILGTAAAALPLPAEETAWLYEAETGTLVGQTRIVHENPDGTGRTWVGGFLQAGDALEFTVDVPAEGFYQLELCYRCDSAKRVPVLVNGAMMGSRLLPATTGFETRGYGRIPLVAGQNILRIDTDWGYADIDYLRLTPAVSPAAFQLSATPVTPGASPEAQALFARLTRKFGGRTFAGQHEARPEAPSRLGQVRRLADEAEPALLGLDFIFYSPIWDRPDGVTETALDWVRRRRGIVTLSWHWLAPIGPSLQVWDSFSTGKTTFDASLVFDETSAEHRAVLRDLDRIAGELKTLRDARVPVLWRPLHEAEGRWFWWGARGPETARRLYRLMFDRFTRVHRLDNLLWVWTTTDDDGALDWYPGDDCVDIVAADLYYPPGSRGDFFTTFDRLRELYNGRKPIALGECGVIPELTARAPWLWFLVWDDHIARPEFNPPGSVRRAYRDSRVVTLPAP